MSTQVYKSIKESKKAQKELLTKSKKEKLLKETQNIRREKAQKEIDEKKYNLRKRKSIDGNETSRKKPKPEMAKCLICHLEYNKKKKMCTCEICDKVTHCKYCMDYSFPDGRFSSCDICSICGCHDCFNHVGGLSYCPDCI
jgi:hypothetical protein